MHPRAEATPPLFVNTIPRVVAVSLALVVLGAPTRALAQRAAYATADELPGEGLPHLADVSLGVGYLRALETGRAPAFQNAGVFAVRGRVLLGSRVGYCVGLDGEVGGGDAGFVYNLTGYLAGVGARWGAGNGVSLCGGAGFSGAGDAVPFAGRFPVELRVAQSLGPVRIALWAQVAWTLGDKARVDGSPSLAFAHEAEAGLSVRIGRQHRYWASTSAGGGPSIGVVYREAMGSRMLGVVLGLDLTGAR